MVKDCPSPGDGRTNSAANFTYLASATLCESPRSERIIVDSGTTSHMTNNKDWLTNCKVLNPPKIVVLGDGHKVFAHGIGTLAVTLHLYPNISTLPTCGTVYSFQICRAHCSQSDPPPLTEPQRSQNQ